MAKKLVVPIIATVIMVAYFIFWIWLCFSQPEVPSVIKLVGIIIPIALISVSVFVLVERINEIRSGEEDDLGKY